MALGTGMSFRKPALLKLQQSPYEPVNLSTNAVKPQAVANPQAAIGQQAEMAKALEKQQQEAQKRQAKAMEMRRRAEQKKQQIMAQLQAQIMQQQAKMQQANSDVALADQQMGPVPQDPMRERSNAFMQQLQGANNPQMALDPMLQRAMLMRGV